MSSVRRFDTPTRVLAGLVADVRTLKRRVGRLTRPFPIPRARVEAKQQGVATSTLYPVEFATVVYNVRGCFTAAQPTRLTAPLDGCYYVSGGFVFEEFASEREVLLGIRVNGENSHAGYPIVQQYRALDDPQGGIGTDVELEAGDYVELIVRQYSGSTLNLLASRRSFLSLRWVEPTAAAEPEVDPL